MDLEKSLILSAAGMKAQGQRLRVISENLANAESTATVADGNPYRRKVVTFQNVLDRKLDMKLVGVDRVREDKTDFPLKYDPAHPGANKDGYVKMPNVNSLIELMDMREAQRSYEANLNMIEVSKSMLTRTLDLLR
jgi:flagellar basal-body rod protein FlgC